jgi:hypothetical protein
MSKLNKTIHDLMDTILEDMEDDQKQAVKGLLSSLIVEEKSSSKKSSKVKEEEEEEEEEEPTEEETTEEEVALEATEEPSTRPTRPPRPTAPPAPPPAATATPTPAPAAPPPPPAAPESGDDPLAGAGDDMGISGPATYDSYTVITDDTGAIAVEVPAEWIDVDGRPFTDDNGVDFFDVQASTDLEAFITGWDVPGIIVNASTEAAQSQNEVGLLDQRLEAFSGQCTYLGREPYADPLYTGQADLFTDCGGTSTGYVILAAVPDSRAFLIRVEVQIVEERDLEAVERALASFVITGDV